MRVTNITFTFDVGTPVVFNELKKLIFDCEFILNFVVWRLRKPRVTALLFESGRVSMSGAKTVEDGKRAARIFARKIQKAGYKQACLRNFKIINVVLYMKLNFRLDVRKLSLLNVGFVCYEPERSPAALLHGEKSKRYRFFPGGSVMITGYSDIESAFLDKLQIVDIATRIKWTQVFT